MMHFMPLAAGAHTVKHIAFSVPQITDFHISVPRRSGETRNKKWLIEGELLSPKCESW